MFPKLMEKMGKMGKMGNLIKMMGKLMEKMVNHKITIIKMEKIQLMEKLILMGSQNNKRINYKV